MVTTLEHFCGTFLHCRLPAQPSEVTCEVVSLEVARQCDCVFLLSELFRWRYNPCIYHEYFFRTVQPMEYMGNSYFVLKNQVIKAERRMLKVSGCHRCHDKALLLRKTVNAVSYVWLAVHPFSVNNVKCLTCPSIQNMEPIDRWYVLQPCGKTALLLRESTATVIW